MGTYTDTPNIFEFATSELSQDAFICWTLKGLEYNGTLRPRAAIYDFSKRFFNLLVDKWNEFCNARHALSEKCLYGAEDITAIEIRRQEDKIDVLAFITFGTGEHRRITPIIVEDKTFTRQHDDQLFRYRKIIREKYGSPEYEAPVCIYYKTGYPFLDGEIVTVSGYAPVFIHDMLDCMRAFDGQLSSDVFRGYYELLCKLDKQDNAILDALRSLNFENALCTHVGQFEMMAYLAAHGENLFKKSGESPEEPPTVLSRMDFGVNIGGAPWTQYMILYPEDCNEAKSGLIPPDLRYADYVFFRIDCNAGGYYLSLRQYNGQLSDEKQKRLERLQETFKAAVEQVERERQDRLPPARILQLFSFKSREKKKESIIATIYFKDLARHDLTQLSELLPIVTREFVKRVVV